MTGFALGIWIFQQTGSALSFALTLLFNMLPKALVAPFAGIFADRYDRRLIMILTDLSAGTATLLTAVLFLTGNLSIWHIYVLPAVNASASAFQGPAFSAAVTQLVPKKQLGRANGMQQLGEGIGLVLAPVMAGIFIAVFGLFSVFLFDLFTFLVAVFILLIVRFPEINKSEKQKPGDTAWVSQIRLAIEYLWNRPGLLGLMVAFTFVNFFVGMAEAVLTPISFALAYLLGGVLADSLFEPLMAKNRLLAVTVGYFIGVGPGRGMG